MKKIIFPLIIVLLCSCNKYKIEPIYIEDEFDINTFKNKLIISYNDEHYISYKIFENSPCFPKILYHSKYFNMEPFFAYRTIPVNIEGEISFIDNYGKGTDSLNYEKLEVQFYLDGKQIVKHHKVFILDECYAIGNEVTTNVIKRKELTSIAKEWSLTLSE